MNDETFVTKAEYCAQPAKNRVTRDCGHSLWEALQAAKNGARAAPATRPAAEPNAILTSSTAIIGSQTTKPSQIAFQADRLSEASV